MEFMLHRKLNNRLPRLFKASHSDGDLSLRAKRGNLVCRGALVQLASRELYNKVKRCAKQ